MYNVYLFIKQNIFSRKNLQRNVVSQTWNIYIYIYVLAEVSPKVFKETIRNAKKRRIGNNESLIYSMDDKSYSLP